MASHGSSRRKILVVDDDRVVAEVIAFILRDAGEEAVLITDKGVSDEAIAPFIAKGIEVHRA